MSTTTAAVTEIAHPLVSDPHKLQALGYDVPPPTVAIIDYAIVSEKLSANGHVFVIAQRAVCL